jgi:hypothetical protein
MNTKLMILLFLHTALTFGQNKEVVIETEAESYSSQTKTEIRKWVVSIDGNASGKKYIQIVPDTRITHDDSLIVGLNFSNEPGKMAIISYKINIPKAGRYYVWVKALSTGGEDNSVHTGLNGVWPETGARMQWCDGKGDWYYESKQRTEAIHCGEPFLIYLDIKKAGKQNIQFSMREDGFKMDKFILTNNKNYKPKN